MCNQVSAKVTLTSFPMIFPRFLADDYTRFKIIFLIFSALFKRRRFKAIIFFILPSARVTIVISIVLNALLRYSSCKNILLTSVVRIMKFFRDDGKVKIKEIYGRWSLVSLQCWNLVLIELVIQFFARCAMYTGNWHFFSARCYRKPRIIVARVSDKS